VISGLVPWYSCFSTPNISHLTRSCDFWLGIYRLPADQRKIRRASRASLCLFSSPLCRRFSCGGCLRVVVLVLGYTPRRAGGWMDESPLFPPEPEPNRAPQQQLEESAAGEAAGPSGQVVRLWFDGLLLCTSIDRWIRQEGGRRSSTSPPQENSRKILLPFFRRESRGSRRRRSLARRGVGCSLPSPAPSKPKPFEGAVGRWEQSRPPARPASTPRSTRSFSS